MIKVSMRILAGLCLFTGLLLGATPPAGSQSLVFAPLPLETPETVVSQWRQLLLYLEQELQIEIRIRYADDYAEIIELFRDGQVDLTFLGPLPYIELRNRFASATPLVLFHETDGQPNYTCSLIALEERGLTPDQVRHLTVALTQPLSTCGYLATNALLHRHGTDLEQNRYRYLDKHDAVAIAVARGRADVGGLKTAIGRKYAHLGLVELAVTEPLPAFALVANAERMSAARMTRIRDLLIGVDAATRANWGEILRHGAAPASDADYDPVRSLCTGTLIPSQGNDR